MDGAIVGSGSRRRPRRRRHGQQSQSVSRQPAQMPDVEILESWYPMLFEQRRVRTGAFGAGHARAGGGNVVTLPAARHRPPGRPDAGDARLSCRSRAPRAACRATPTELAVRRGDGRREQVSTAAAGVVVEAGEAFEIRCSSGGGVGDPLLRDPAEGRRRRGHGLLSAAQGRGGLRASCCERKGFADRDFP